MNKKLCLQAAYSSVGGNCLTNEMKQEQISRFSFTNGL
jgi:hypothetical protein